MVSWTYYIMCKLAGWLADTQLVQLIIKLIVSIYVSIKKEGPGQEGNNKFLVFVHTYQCQGRKLVSLYIKIK